MWSPPLLNPTGHDWGRKALPYGCGTQRELLVPAVPGSLRRPPVIAYHWAQTRCIRCRTSCFVSGWHIFMFHQHGIRSPLMSKVGAPWALRGCPVVSDIGIIAAGSLGSFEVFTHQTHRFGGEHKSCVWFVSVCPAELLYSWSFSSLIVFITTLGNLTALQPMPLNVCRLLFFLPKRNKKSKEFVRRGRHFPL